MLNHVPQDNSQRLVVSHPRNKAKTQKDAAQSSSDARPNSQTPVASGSRQRASTQEALAQSSGDSRRNSRRPAASHSASARDGRVQPGSSSQVRRRRHAQGLNDGEESDASSGIVYTTRDTESVRPHGCWNIFWDWLCYKSEFLAIRSQPVQFMHRMHHCHSLLILVVSCSTS